MMTVHHALEGLNEQYWGELDDIRRRIYFKGLGVISG